MVIAAILKTQHVLWSCRGEDKVLTKYYLEDKKNKLGLSFSAETKTETTYQQILYCSHINCFLSCSLDNLLLLYLILILMLC